MNALSFEGKYAGGTVSSCKEDYKDGCMQKQPAATRPDPCHASSSKSLSHLLPPNLPFSDNEKKIKIESTMKTKRGLPEFVLAPRSTFSEFSTAVDVSKERTLPQHSATKLKCATSGLSHTYTPPLYHTLELYYPNPKVPVRRNLEAVEEDLRVYHEKDGLSTCPKMPDLFLLADASSDEETRQCGRAESQTLPFRPLVHSSSHLFSLFDC